MSSDIHSFCPLQPDLIFLTLTVSSYPMPSDQILSDDFRKVFRVTQFYSNLAATWTFKHVVFVMTMVSWSTDFLFSSQTLVCKVCCSQRCIDDSCHTIVHVFVCVWWGTCVCVCNLHILSYRLADPVHNCCLHLLMFQINSLVVFYNSLLLVNHRQPLPSSSFPPQLYSEEN